jgi:hypothetical protein
MNDKIKLLELANAKAATDEEFIAYFLNHYLKIEQTTTEAVMTILNCNVENYYKLGLCKAPTITDSDYLDRLNNISSYVGISVLELNKIIKRVNTVLQLRNLSTGENAVLMAARDKKKRDNSDS